MSEHETILVSRSTTIEENSETYKRLMEESGISSVQIVERDEEYGSVFVVYGVAKLLQLARFASLECCVEGKQGLLCL